MLIFAQKSTLFQDRYQALILPVATSGIHKHRQLLKIQSLYPEQHQRYKHACDKSEFATGDILLYQTQRDLAGMAVGGALSKPKFIVAMAVTDYSEDNAHLVFVQQALAQLKPLLLRWGRYDGIRRVAVLAPDELIVPPDRDFETAILPLLETYINPVNTMSILVYR